MLGHFNMHFCSGVDKRVVSGEDLELGKGYGTLYNRKSTPEFYIKKVKFAGKRVPHAPAHLTFDPPLSIISGIVVSSRVSSWVEKALFCILFIHV